MDGIRLSARCFIAAGVALNISGCSLATDALMPVFESSIFGNSDSEISQPVETISESTQSSPPTMSMQPPIQPMRSSVINVAVTGTFVNQKANQFGVELNQLRSTLASRNSELSSIRSTTVSNASSYHGLVGNIKSRLQVGTTPGNPEVMSQWRSSQDQLDRIEDDISEMNKLKSQVASDSAMSAYLLDSVRAAFGLTGAVDEDHRQLRRLEDEVNQTTVTIQRLLGELNEDMDRQQEFVNTEREKLMELATDINAGQLYVAPRDVMGTDIASINPRDFSNRKPLVVIRFDRQDVTFEPALYQAVSRALERRPGAVFDLVAVSPNSGSRNLSTGAARRNAEKVLQSLSRMGLPSERIMLSAMSSESVRSSEVHIYLR